ncbi:uncharacterized protein PRCAT00002401001 [Priceomyces carsonii]|uniref:uncharacterized protein n=1 Tax=Priceomyces carsonii TaxID=28549 RepID=UPI002EDA441B|nr:unnamed protein product [Priceomyces carsonii]
MDDNYNKENEVSSINSQTLLQVSSLLSAKVLVSKKSINKLNSTLKLDSPTASPRKKQIQMSLQNMEKDYCRLEKQCEELLLKNRNLTSENTHLEHDLEKKLTFIQDQSDRIAGYERTFKHIQNEYSRSKDLYTREINCYKELIEDLQLKVSKLALELKNYQELQNSFEDLQDAFSFLSKKHKVLQSNFELEKCSKIALIDEVERLSMRISQLTKEESIQGANNNEYISDVESHFTEEEYECSVYNDKLDTKNLSSEEEVEDSHFVSYLADDLRNNHSSPIKQNFDDSFEMSSNFQFPSSVPILNKDDNEENGADNREMKAYSSEIQLPPSPDLNVKQDKRQSLPDKLKSSGSYSPKDDFILSPFKLGGNNDSCSDTDTTVMKTTKRYSFTKPSHSRYNSHDILPIKVEFEAADGSNRSSSAPDKEHISRHENFENIPEEIPRTRRSVRNSAFMTLSGMNGYSNTPSNRNSLLTNSSSKSSSLVIDNHLTNELNRQEIMKLKFELQSLKLHNEKLLSYIGFELQKQKKNIRRLSSRKSLNNLNNKKIEYSDAKLIEKSRNMLIHKKRVLRSVSINTILSKKYQSGLNGILANGLYGFPGTNLIESQFEDYEPEKEDDEDDYGFLNHDDKFCKRIFSHGLYAYLKFDDIDEDIPADHDKNVKKFKSQTFANRCGIPEEEFESEFEEEEGDSDEYEDEGDWEDISNVLDELQQTSVLSHIKYLIFGSFLSQKKSKNETLVDDGLKYKFFTIAIGIMIVGLKLSHTNNYPMST